jgi:hypothetical protein
MCHDEIYVVEQSAWFAGLDVPQMGTYYYGYFQALLYSPLFWFLKDPVHIYQGMLIINAVEASLIAVIAYRILHNYFRVPKKSSVLISVASGLFPSLVLVSKIAWNEVALYILIWLIFLLFIKELCNENNNRQKKLSSALIAVLCVFAYGAHNRALLYIIVFCILVIILAIIRKKQIVNLLAFFSVLAICFIANAFLVQYLKSTLWIGTSLINTPEEEILNLQFLFHWDTVKLFLKSVVGNLFSSFNSTFGLTALGLIANLTLVFRYIANHKKKQHTQRDFFEFSISLSLLLLYVGAVLVCSLFYMQSYISDSNFDRMLTIRYIDNISGLLIFYTLYLIWEKFNSVKKHLWTTIPLYAAVSILFFRYTFPLLQNSVLNIWQALPSSIFIDFYKTGTLSPENMSAYAIFSFSIFLILFLLIWFRKKTIHFFIVFALFAYIDVTVYFKNIQYPSVSSYNLAQSLNEIVNKLSTATKAGTNFYFDEDSGARAGYIYNSLFDPFIYTDYVNFDINKNPYDQTIYVTSKIDLSLIQPGIYTMPIPYKEHAALGNREPYFKDKYLVIDGESAADELLAQGYRLYKEGYPFPQELFVTGNARFTDNSIALDNGGIQFGPYFNLPAGKYEVIVEGENLQSALFNITGLNGNVTYDYTIPSLSDNRAVYRFELPENMLQLSTEEFERIEFININTSNRPIKINNMILKKLQ